MTPRRGGSKARVFWERGDAGPDDRLLDIALDEIFYLLSALDVGQAETYQTLKGWTSLRWSSKGSAQRPQSRSELVGCQEFLAPLFA